MKHKLRNAIVLATATTSLAAIWNIQASDRKSVQAQWPTPPDSLRQNWPLPVDSLTIPQNFRTPYIDTLKWTPGMRDLLLRPADKAEYTVRDLLLRPEDQRRYAFTDTLRQDQVKQEKPK